MDKALLVGINTYPGCPLEGCINDVNDMANLLVSKFNYKMDDIRLLTDNRATTNNIFDRLKWLCQCNSGDRIFFHYSGHGAQVPTRGAAGEVDDLYEVICPVDFDWSMERMITDKQFVEIFSKIPSGVKFNWISDSCHSGDLDREIQMPTIHAKVHTKVLGHRSYPVPSDIKWRHRTARSKNMSSRGMINGQLDVGFISGCQSDQTSADASFGGRPNGALSYFLFQELNKNTLAPLSQIAAGIVNDMSEYGYSQRPACSGSQINQKFQ